MTSVNVVSPPVIPNEGFPAASRIVHLAPGPAGKLRMARMASSIRREKPSAPLEAPPGCAVL
ncbi:hypothetical protein [Saccharopolyspora gloriosae]|uniref:hypothetical protein n=1 Tax=Saccharopolyspora gloriosae TaxID=455344 RepID=UPI001FB67F85|nr:hypothetical protein [Saccharopolyspora gloriosae]